MKHVLLSSLLLAAASAPLAQQPPITRTTTTGVPIDVTVLDRNGQPALDLRQDEFELSEGGSDG